MKPALSVITCTHNPRPEYLALVIEALKRQTLDPSQWGFILVDNASDVPLQGRIDMTWHPRACIVEEHRLGLTSARLRGIAEAEGELLIFVDDDNVLDRDFLQKALDVAQRHPNIGAFGGQAIPEFEKTPEPWTRRYWGSLALREFDTDRWSNVPLLPDTTPVGAGLCVRRNVAMRYLEMHKLGLRPLQLDRAGASLLSGGDVDLATTACDLDMGTGVFAALRLRHLIPPERLTEEYLLRLVSGISFSAVVLDQLRRPDALKPSQPLKTRIANLLRWTLLSTRERRFTRAHAEGARLAHHALASRRRG